MLEEDACTGPRVSMARRNAPDWNGLPFVSDEAVVLSYILRLSMNLMTTTPCMNACGDPVQSVPFERNETMNGGTGLKKSGQ